MSRDTPRQSVLPCCLLLGLGLLLSASQKIQAQPSGPVRFEKEVIDSGFDGGYGVTLADIDGDGSDDILALAYRPSALAWYSNPDWQKHVIETGHEGLIEVSPHDIDGDGALDLTLVSDFNLADSMTGGQVSWLRNPAAGQEEDNGDWVSHPIDAVPTSHRLRWADVSGTGARVLVNLPIIGKGAESPLYRGGAELTAYSIPADSAGPWGHVVLADSFAMAHGLAVLDWDDDGREELLVASYDGLDLVALASRGEFVTTTNLVEPTFTERPRAGISEVAAGNGGAGQRFLATIEPWHGNEVAVYRQGGDGQWNRRRIDDELVSGHALLTVDLDNDGYDEIVAGGRGEPHALFIYRYDAGSDSWQRTVLDRAVAVSGLSAGDLNGDGHQDIVAVGAATANVVIYHNMGR